MFPILFGNVTIPDSTTKANMLQLCGQSPTHFKRELKICNWKKQMLFLITNKYLVNTIFEKKDIWTDSYINMNIKYKQNKEHLTVLSKLIIIIKLCDLSRLICLLGTII